MSFASHWLSNTDVSPGHVYNFTLDVDTCTSNHVKIDTCSAEFPTSHPYRNGVTGTRYIYLMASDRKELLPYRDVVKVSFY